MPGQPDRATVRPADFWTEREILILKANAHFPTRAFRALRAAGYRRTEAAVRGKMTDLRLR